jgi:hypothetical protein
MGSPAPLTFGGVVVGGINVVGRSPGRSRTVCSGAGAGVPIGAVVDIRYRISYFVVVMTVLVRFQSFLTTFMMDFEGLGA